MGIERLNLKARYSNQQLHLKGDAGYLQVKEYRQNDRYDFFYLKSCTYLHPRVLLSKTILKKRIKIVFRGLYFNSL